MQDFEHTTSESQAESHHHLPAKKSKWFQSLQQLFKTLHLGNRRHRSSRRTIWQTEPRGGHQTFKPATGWSVSSRKVKEYSVKDSKEGLALKPRPAPPLSHAPLGPLTYWPTYYFICKGWTEAAWRTSKDQSIRWSEQRRTNWLSSLPLKEQRERLIVWHTAEKTMFSHHNRGLKQQQQQQQVQVSMEI